jgi:hypothetical protein
VLRGEYCFILVGLHLQHVTILRASQTAYKEQAYLLELGYEIEKIHKLGIYDVKRGVRRKK